MNPFDMKARPWIIHASCRGMDPDLFHPAPNTGMDHYRKLRALCASCPVRLVCLEDALEIDGQTEGRSQGFVGGMSPHERDRERARRKAA